MLDYKLLELDTRLHSSPVLDRTAFYRSKRYSTVSHVVTIYISHRLRKEFCAECDTNLLYTYGFNTIQLSGCVEAKSNEYSESS